MKHENLLAKELTKTGNELILVKQIIQMQTDLINRIPSPKQLTREEVIIQFMTIYQETKNIFELNQDLTKILEEAGTKLYELADDLEEELGEE